MTMGPSPETRYPLPGVTRTVFLRPFITRANIIVGDYTYYDDPDGPEQFERHVLYHFDFIGDRLIIGRFCCIASGVRFIMNGGNHATSWLTTYPFPIFSQGWELPEPPAWPNKGDTTVGNDVWLGNSATVMPGITIGDGAVVATSAVVTRNVPPYAIVGGNPATVLRYRFEAHTIARLLALRWWDWDPARIARNVALLCGGDIEALERAVP
jgi:virginiamycin A acetyltransferase